MLYKINNIPFYCQFQLKSGFLVYRFIGVFWCSSRKKGSKPNLPKQNEKLVSNIKKLSEYNLSHNISLN